MLPVSSFELLVPPCITSDSVPLPGIFRQFMVSPQLLRHPDTTVGTLCLSNTHIQAHILSASQGSPEKQSCICGLQNIRKWSDQPALPHGQLGEYICISLITYWLQRSLQGTICGWKFVEFLFSFVACPMMVLSNFVFWIPSTNFSFHYVQDLMCQLLGMGA